MPTIYCQILIFVDKFCWFFYHQPEIAVLKNSGLKNLVQSYYNMVVMPNYFYKAIKNKTWKSSVKNVIHFITLQTYKLHSHSTLYWWFHWIRIRKSLNLKNNTNLKFRHKIGRFLNFFRVSNFDFSIFNFEVTFCISTFFRNDFLNYLKGTLMQIWKSTNIFVFLWKLFDCFSQVSSKLHSNQAWSFSVP